MVNYTRLRDLIKKRFDTINNESLKRNLLQAIPFWVASVITGLFAVGYARLFALAEEGAHKLVKWHDWSVFIATPLFFYMAWLVVQKWEPLARGSGIPQVMAAIELATPRENHKVGLLLGARMIVVKIISSCFMVLGGGAIGREGPTIQIAGSVFRFINTKIPESWPRVSKRNMIMTGAAAGLAAAFNTPLGGIVFAVEELARSHFRHFRTAIFAAVIIAGLTAQGLLGPYLYLGYPDMSNLSWYIIFVVMLVGIIAGLGGSFMAKVILKIMKFKNSLDKKHLLYFLFGCAMIMALFGYFFNGMATGSGKEIMTTTLFTENKTVEWYLPILRFIGTVTSFSVGGAGGVFAPALGGGASVGAVLAEWFSFGGSNANILIMAGMVAFLTGITRSPFTSAILVLEMTDRHNVIFHLMAAALVANAISLLIDRRSLYDHLKDGYLHEVRHPKQQDPAPVPAPVSETDAKEPPPVPPIN